MSNWMYHIFGFKNESNYTDIYTENEKGKKNRLLIRARY